jgi:hypothetical protein
MVKKELYLITCMGNVMFMDTYKKCEKYVNQTYIKYPNHAELCISKFIGVLKKNG